MHQAQFSGILTFLFTDLEGSTPLWEKEPELMQEVSARHDKLLRRVFDSIGGRVVKTTGDGFHVVFESPSDGLAAALAAQQAIATEDWPETIGPIRVRMGLHSGESQARGDDYYGPELNRAARIMGIGNGGQILISETTAVLLRGRLPDQAALKDLGMHRLKGLKDPEHIFQLEHPSIESDFPPLQSTIFTPNNLPVQVTQFIGREREMIQVRQILEQSRLLTLVGPGGTGKTRLMLQSASGLLDDFPEGVWLIELAALTNPQLITEKTAGLLGVHGQPGHTLLDSLVIFLRRKEMLMLLDNAEHLIDATAELAQNLLTGCPLVKILVTSREPLGIAGETTYQVPSLSLPAEQVRSRTELEDSEAVQLFIERARTVRPDFQISPSEIPAVAEIVRGLDGIPLALELAAARLRVMSVQQIAKRLNDRFRLLVGGRRTAQPRQQTLQALIDWSWNLLDTPEQILLRRLSVFSGGWLLADAQQVAGDENLDEYSILDNLEALVQKSLVTHRPLEGISRFDMLESIRQYARDRLSEAGEEPALQDRHAAYFIDLVRQAEKAKIQQETVIWIQRLVRETDNFQAAFDRLEVRDPLEFIDTASRLLMLGGHGIWSFSPPRAYRWLNRAIKIGRSLEVTEEKRPQLQKFLGQALGVIGSVDFALGRHEEGAEAGKQAESLLRPFGKTPELAYSIASYAFNLGFLGRPDEALEIGEEARTIAIELEDWVGLSVSLGALGLSALMRGDIEQAFQYLDEGKVVVKKIGRSWIGPQLLIMEGRLLAQTGEMAKSELVYKEADQRYQELGELTQSMITRSELGHVLRNQGKWEQSRSYYRETIRFFQDMGHEPAVANQLECFAYVETALENPEKASKLLGAAQVIRERTNNPITLPWEKRDFQQAFDQLAQMLGVAGRDAAIENGRHLSLDEAVSYAIDN